MFGSIGVGLESPCMDLEALESPVLEAEGDDPERTQSFAEKFYQATGIPKEVRSRLLLRSGLPPHAGLGSGTQLALTVGKALSILHNVPFTTREIASMMGRGRRSGAGIALFDDGGLVIDGGKKTDGNDELPPLLFRRMIPENWFFVLAIPGSGMGMSGEREVEAFRDLPGPTPEVSGAICRETLMRLLPALEEEDLGAFGEAVTSIQRMVGDCFSPAQSGRFASPLSGRIIRSMKELGAAGVGQSSWGPAVYGIVEGIGVAKVLAAEIARLFKDHEDLEVTVSAAARKGAAWNVEPI